MRKIAIALLVFAVLGIGGYLGVSAYAQKEAERQVDAAFDSFKAQGLDASHGAVDVTLRSRQLDIADVTLTAPNAGTTTIGRVTASGLMPPSGGRIRIDRIEARNIAFDGPSPASPSLRARYRIPAIIVETYDGPERFAADGPEPWRLLLGFLEAASAGAVSAESSILESFAPDGASTLLTYGAVRLQGIAGGKIATITVAPSSFAVKPAAGARGSANGALGRIDARGLDIAAMLALLDPARRAAGTEFRTLYESIEADGFTADLDEGVKQQWGKMRVGSVAVKPADLPLEQLVAFGLHAQDLQAKGETPSPAETARMLDTLAGVYGAIRLGGASFEAMTQEQPGLGKVTLKTLRLGDMADGRLACFALEGFAGADADGRPVKLDHLVIEGIRPGEAMTLAADAMSDPASLHALPRQLAAFQVIEGIDIAGLEAPVGPLADDVVKLDTLKLSWGSFVGPVPTRIAANLRVSGPIDALTDQQPFDLLAASGASRATIAFDAGLNWNEADKTYVVSPLLLNVGDAFSASAKITLTGVDKASFLAAGQADGLDGVLAANLGSADITLTDAGLYQLKLRQVAEDQGASPEAVQQLALGIAQMIAQPVMNERPELAGAVSALLDFLSAPKGTLRLKIMPRSSLPLISVIQAANDDPTALLDVVNIEATSTR